LYKSAVSIYHAANYAPDPEVREACSETSELLNLFAMDIVDNDYLIRSKDRNGVAYRPGVDPQPAEARTGDLASFTSWDLFGLDQAECHGKQASAYLGYGDKRDVECTPYGGYRFFEVLAYRNNPPNAHIMRSFHVAKIALALHSGDYETALDSLYGLEERFEGDLNLDITYLERPQDYWYREIIVNWLQAATAGYYLTHDEIRLIQLFASRAIDKYTDWENWDLWADTIPENEELKVHPPSSETLEDETKVYWLQTYALGLFMDYCFGLYVNPDSPKIIDCEIFDF
jgi:hypothetical protein